MLLTAQAGWALLGGMQLFTAVLQRSVWGALDWREAAQRQEDVG